MARVTVYDSEAGTLIAGGIPVNDLRAEEFLTYEPEGDAFGDEIGADGGVARWATHETRYKVEVKLKAASEHNQQFSALHAADSGSTNGVAIGPFLYKDGTGVTVLIGAQCWIVKAPSESAGVKRGDKTWTFRVISSPVKSIFGGN